MNAIEGVTFTEAFISQKRAKPEQVTRWAITKVVQTMREYIRRQKVETLLRAEAMTLIVDDKGPYRVILFHSNLANERGGKGLLQVFRSDREDVASYEDDYSLRMAKSIEESLLFLSTPLHGDVNPHVYEHLRQICRFYTSDGLPAALKCGELLAGRLPNLTMVHRDTAHAVRLGVFLPITLLLGTAVQSFKTLMTCVAGW